MTFKIIRTDNYDREARAQQLVCENIANQKEGNLMVEALNADPKRSTDDWFKLVGKDYKLWGGMAELV